MAAPAMDRLVPVPPLVPCRVPAKPLKRLEGNKGTRVRACIGASKGGLRISHIYKGGLSVPLFPFNKIKWLDGTRKGTRGGTGTRQQRVANLGATCLGPSEKVIDREGRTVACGEINFGFAARGIGGNQFCRPIDGCAGSPRLEGGGGSDLWDWKGPGPLGVPRGGFSAGDEIRPRQEITAGRSPRPMAGQVRVLRAQVRRMAARGL